MNDFSELDDWDPMAEDFYNPVFNSYRDIQKSITHDLSKLYIRNIPKDYTEEQLLSLMSEGNRRVRHICLFPVKKYESTTAGIVGFYTEKMAEEALKFFSDHPTLKFRIEYATRKMTERVMLKQIGLWMPVKKPEKVDPPQAKNDDLSQSTKVNLLQSTKANLSQSTKADLPLSTKANLSQSTKVNLSQSTKVNLSQSTKVNLSQSTKVNFPQSTKGNLSQSTKADLPLSTKVNLPQSKKALKDEVECKENLPPNQPPVEPLSPNPLLCRICGNQIGATIFSDRRGKYCTNRCRMLSLRDLVCKLEADKLNKVEEKDTISDQIDKEKSVPSTQSEKNFPSNENDREKPVASDPLNKRKPHKSMRMTIKESYLRMVEENRRKRQYIRKYMAEETAEDREESKKILELLNSGKLRSKIEEFMRPE